MVDFTPTTQQMRTLASACLLFLAASLASGNDTADLFARLDTDGGERLTPQEVSPEYAPLFERILRKGDFDGDGELTAAEFQAGLKTERPEKPLSKKGSPSFPGSDSLLLLLAMMDQNADLTILASEVPPNLRGFYDQLVSQTKSGNPSLIRVRQLQQEAPRLTRLAVRTTRQLGLDVEVETSLLPDHQFAMVEKLKSSLRPAEGLVSRGSAVTMFEQLDADGDGIVKSAELPPMLAERLSSLWNRIDRNGDDQLTKAELASFGEQMERMQANRPAPEDTARQVDQLIVQGDTDGDGYLSRAEAPRFLTNRFDRVDADANGLLDRDELSRAASALGSFRRSGTTLPGRPVAVPGNRRKNREN